MAFIFAQEKCFLSAGRIRVWDNAAVGCPLAVMTWVQSRRDSLHHQEPPRLAQSLVVIIHIPVGEIPHGAIRPLPDIDSGGGFLRSTNPESRTAVLYEFFIDHDVGLHVWDGGEVTSLLRRSFGLAD